MFGRFIFCPDDGGSEFLETLVHIYQTTRRRIQEDSNLQYEAHLWSVQPILHYSLLCLKIAAQHFLWHRIWTEFLKWFMGNMGSYKQDCVVGQHEWNVNYPTLKKRVSYVRFYKQLSICSDDDTRSQTHWRYVDKGVLFCLVKNAWRDGNVLANSDTISLPRRTLWS